MTLEVTNILSIYMQQNNSATKEQVYNKMTDFIKS